jgi:hypothetical protein
MHIKRSLGLTAFVFTLASAQEVPVTTTEAPATETTVQNSAQTVPPVQQQAVTENKQINKLSSAEPTKSLVPQQEVLTNVVNVVEAPTAPTSVPPTPEQDFDDIDQVDAQEEFVEQKNPEGIDTVSLEDAQGNWLFKRVWWERAEDRYGKIRELVNSVWESRTKFFSQRNQLDREILDPFYVSIGMGQGELNTILSELSEFFQKEREKSGDLNEKERALYETLEEEQEALRQLKADVESISNLDHAVDEALSVLMDQINKARQLEKQAWENFKEIAHVLSDVKAREIYYMMDGAGRNIKNISLYLEKDFSDHFSRLISQAKNHVTRVLNQIKSLKEKGVDFRRQVDRLAQQEEQEKRDKEVMEEDEQSVNATSKPKPKKGWLEWILALPAALWETVVAIVRIPYDLIFGGKK